MPTGNLLIDNPNTFRRPYHDPILRALSGPNPAPEPFVSTAVDEESAPTPKREDVRAYIETGRITPGAPQPNADVRRAIASTLLAEAQSAPPPRPGVPEESACSESVVTPPGAPPC